jgi:hypothetical protein
MLITKMEDLLEFNTYLDTLFIQYANTNHKIFSDAFAKYPTIYKNLNQKIYEWYFGTFLNKIVTMVFQPYLYDPDWESLVPLTEQRYRSLSDIQIRDALWHTYYLIINNHCDSTIKDYYDVTPFEYVSSARDSRTPVDDYIYHYIPSFEYVLKYGTSVVLKQQEYVKRWYSRYIKKRKHAVSVFESRWLEVILNPYTRHGCKRLKQVEDHFYQVAKSLCVGNVCQESI